jgi:Mn2+/Fe2+ NRAMP family transporter
MLLFAIIFFVAAMAVTFIKRPDRPPYRTQEYRWDDRVVASILMLLAIAFAAVAWLD